LGNFIVIDGKQREVVKVKSDNPTHAGYYTTYRDQMKPGEEEYFEPVTGEVKAAPPVKHRRSRK
jgi:hypothetical protein